MDEDEFTVDQEICPTCLRSSGDGQPCSKACRDQDDARVSEAAQNLEGFEFEPGY